MLCMPCGHNGQCFGLVVFYDNYHFFTKEKRFIRKKSGNNTLKSSPSSSPEDALRVLSDYDIVFIIDDSGSMQGARWKEAGKALAGVAEIASRYDADGVNIYFLNSHESGNGLTASDEVGKLFLRVQPDGQTPTGACLDLHLNWYIDQAKRAKDEGKKLPKPVNFIVITDGVPTDDPRSVIINAARRLDADSFLLSQLGIQFIQVGEDSGATQALIEMDNDLTKKERIRDIVDTTPYEGKALDAEKIVKILLGAINRRVDTMGGASVL